MCANVTTGPNPLTNPCQGCHTTGIPKETHMETLDLETLALLADLEADLDVPDFDADEMLDTEA